MNKSIVVTGEASETDSEDEFKDVTLNSSMTKSVQGAVIPGEDSESDNEIDASVASATSALNQCQFVANNDPKFDSLLHQKLRECNEQLHYNIENVCESTINDAAKHLSVIDQHLIRSETNVENSVTAVKSPAKQFRYLPGDVNYNTNMADLEVFNLHRFKIFSAKPIVDDIPLKMNPYKLMPYSKMKDYTAVECEISNENKKLMNKINYIHRNGGKVDSYNPNAYRRDEWSWNLHLTFMQGIVKANRQIYDMIMRTEPKIKNKEFEDSFKLHEKRLRGFCRYQICVGMKPDYDTILSRQPSISYGLDQEKTSVRPQCFLEFKVRDGPYLGKIFIELYQDFVPVTCQNFMEICKGEGELTYKGCLLHRIVKGKFIETGDITHNNGRGGMSVFGKTFPEEKHVLKHTRAGVVSMKRVLYSENNSQFIITLTEMQQWDKMHVVFGKVVKGNSVLFLLEDYGRRIGKPYTDVVISNCGVIEAEGEEREKKDEAEAEEGEQT